MGRYWSSLRPDKNRRRRPASSNVSHLNRKCWPSKFADATALQAQAVALDNQNPEMLYALAQRYAAARRDADAMKYLGDAIAKDPARFRKRAAADAWFARLSKRADFQRLTRPPR